MGAGKETGRTWYLCPELNSSFESLFQPVTEIRIINIRSLLDPRKLFYQLTARQRFGNDDILNHKTDGILHQDFYESLKNPVYLFTWEHFYPSHDYHLPLLRSASKLSPLPLETAV